LFSAKRKGRIYSSFLIPPPSILILFLSFFSFSLPLYCVKKCNKSIRNDAKQSVVQVLTFCSKALVALLTAGGMLVSRNQQYRIDRPPGLSAFYVLPLVEKLLRHYLLDPFLQTFYFFFYVDFITLFLSLLHHKFTTSTVRQNSFLYSV
jgi:hypothetical protein